jgi:hypothetical protein
MRYPEGKVGDTYIIPEGITNILVCAFSGQRYLKSITVPESVTQIDDGAFDGCLSDLTLYCHENSYAHTYAKEHNLKHEPA